MLDRLELLIGEDNVRKLQNKTVLLIGLGGVGGYAFESLVRSGVGTIIIVDNDKFDVTNLNRQVLATKESIGQYKVEEAEKRKNKINENCNIIKIKQFIDKDNINDLFKYKIDFVIDAIDTIKTKKEIIEKCLNEKIEFISIMGTGGKMDPNGLEITSLDKTCYDPIAKILRSELKQAKKKIPVVFSKEKPKTTKPIGSNSYVPALAGLMAAGYCINQLLEGDNNG